MMEKVFLYYNSKSGRNFIKSKLDTIVQAFQKENQLLTLYSSSKNEDIEKLLKEVRVLDYSKIIVAGGDGTISNFVDAMVKSNIDIPFGIIPAGTSNDYANALNYPKSIDAVLKIITTSKSKKIDVGLAGTKYFINVFSVGEFPAISQTTDKDAKKILGPVAYYLKGFQELSKLKTLNIKIKYGRKKIEEKIIFMLVMNGITAGGFDKLAKSSKINDGLLDVIIFRDIPFYEFVPTFLDVVSGNPGRNKNIIMFKTSSLYIQASRKVMTDVDGEKGDSLPLQVKVLHKKLNVILGDQVGKH